MSTISSWFSSEITTLLFRILNVWYKKGSLSKGVEFMTDYRKVYLDYSATTPVKEEVLNEMIPYFTERYGNASSLYTIGLESKAALDKAREQVANLVGASPKEIYFTGSGSEADNWALKNMAFDMRAKGKGNHIITSRIEHHAILHTCEYLEKQGFEVTYLDVDKEGFVSPEDLQKNYKEFKEAGCEIYSVSTDTHFTHKAWHDHSERISKIEYPMLADPTHVLSRDFEVYIEENGLAERGSFIINPDGKIVSYEVNAGGVGRNADELLRKLRACQFVHEHGDQVCPAKWQPGAETLKPSLDLVGQL